MKLLLCQETVRADPKLLESLAFVIRQDAPFLKASYPRFDDWLNDKVIPGIASGERTVVIEHRDLHPVGLLIVKHTKYEKKLCTLRVRQNYESRGLGVRLFETAFDLLGTDRPLLSVSEPTMPKFERLFRHFGFAREAIYAGIYLPMVHEVSFNGRLEARCQETGPLTTQVGRAAVPWRISDQETCRAPYRNDGGSNSRRLSPSSPMRVNAEHA